MTNAAARAFSEAKAKRAYDETAGPKWPGARFRAYAVKSINNALEDARKRGETGAVTADGKRYAEHRAWAALQPPNDEPGAPKYTELPAVVDEMTQDTRDEVKAFWRQFLPGRSPSAQQAKYLASLDLRAVLAELRGFDPLAADACRLRHIDGLAFKREQPTREHPQTVDGIAEHMNVSGTEARRLVTRGDAFLGLRLESLSDDRERVAHGIGGLLALAEEFLNDDEPPAWVAAIADAMGRLMDLDFPAFADAAETATTTTAEATHPDYAVTADDVLARFRRDNA
jgi:hypothetical protein